MGKLVVFLQTNKLTGAVCNPGLTVEDAARLYMRAPPNEFPICVKCEGIGKFGVTIDCTWPGLVTQQSLISLLNALERLDPSNANSDS